MASALMTQWLFNFIIAKLTPIMLNKITYGTFLLFGSCCVAMTLWVIICVPETRGVPLESIGVLFEGNIIQGAIRDTMLRRSRATQLRHATNVNIERHDEDDDEREIIISPAEHIKRV